MSVFQFDVLQVVAKFTYTLDGDQQVNTFHYEYQDGATLSEADVFDDMGVILEELYGNIIATQPATYKYIDYTVYDLTQGTLVGDGAWPTFTAGTGTGSLVAPQNCALVLGKTLLSKVQGRKYLGGFEDGDVTLGVWDSATQTALAAFGADMIRDDIIAGFTYAPIAYNTVLDRRQPFTSSKVISGVRTQRRRTIGRGS